MFPQLSISPLLQRLDERNVVALQQNLAYSRKYRQLTNSPLDP